MNDRRICILLAAVTLLWSGCDEKEPTEEPRQNEAVELPRTETSPSIPRKAPEPEEPERPDYEDAPGTVKKIANTWVIVTDDQDERRICLPADTPADVTEEGAKVRFTLYLETVKPDEERVCHPVQMLVSIRRAG